MTGIPPEKYKPCILGSLQCNEDGEIPISPWLSILPKSLTQPTRPSSPGFCLPHLLLSPCFVFTGFLFNSSSHAPFSSPTARFPQIALIHPSDLRFDVSFFRRYPEIFQTLQFPQHQLSLPIALFTLATNYD